MDGLDLGGFLYECQLWLEETRAVCRCTILRMTFGLHSTFSRVAINTTLVPRLNRADSMHVLYFNSIDWGRLFKALSIIGMG